MCASVTCSSTPRRPPVVGLEAAPELLADALSRIIAQRGLEVVRLSSAEDAPYEGQRSNDVDVAVVCGGVPGCAPADVVVCLPEGDLDASEATTDVLVVGPHGHVTVEVTDLERLVELVVELLADC